MTRSVQLHSEGLDLYILDLDRSNRVSNTLAYYTVELIKSLIIFFRIGANVIKLFAAIITNFCNKLERLSPTNFSRE